MIVEVAGGSPTPPYEQIRSQVALMIRAGTLRPGSQLPPIRQLAADLGLAANTVARAYRELESEGLVVSRVRHGTTVAATPTTPMDSAEVNRLLDEAATAFAGAARQLGAEPEVALSAARRALATIGGPSVTERSSQEEGRH